MSFEKPNLHELKEDSIEALCEFFDWKLESEVRAMVRGLTAVQLNELRTAVDELQRKAMAEGYAEGYGN